eukprot:1159743-Pelagomonas_calceolata.AAC.7
MESKEGGVLQAVLERYKVPADMFAPVCIIVDKRRCRLRTCEHAEWAIQILTEHKEVPARAHKNMQIDKLPKARLRRSSGNAQFHADELARADKNMQIDKLPRDQIEKELAALGVSPDTVEGEVTRSGQAQGFCPASAQHDSMRVVFWGNFSKLIPTAACMLCTIPDVPFFVEHLSKELHLRY